MNGVNFDGVWTFSTETCLQGCDIKFIEYVYYDHCLHSEIKLIVAKCRETVSDNKSKGDVRPHVT